MDNLENRETQLTQFTEELSLLQEKVKVLTSRVTALEKGSVSEVEQTSYHSEIQSHQGEPDQGWAKLGQEVLLPRVAAVSFMMVVALILRTVTDNGMIDQQFGSYMGTLYALGLIGWGSFLYSKSHKLAPVFPACGVLLLYSIIYETHVHFESLSSTTVYSILLIAEIAAVLIGLRCRAVTLLYFAAFGSTFVGLAIGFPEPLFPLLGVVLVVNSLAGHWAARRKIAVSLRWYTLVFSWVFWLLWAYKLNYALRFGANAQELGVNWCMPVMLLFFLTYMYSSLSETRDKGSKVGFFHYLLPAINCGATFFVVYFVAGPWLGHSEIVGYAAVLLSAILIAFVTNIAGKSDDDRGIGKEYVFAATILLIQGLYIIMPVTWALPIWAAAAAVLSLLSARWQSGAVRVVSYLFQVFIVYAAIHSRSYVEGEGNLWVSFVVAGGLAACCLWLYGWCRRNIPTYNSFFFKEIDLTDKSAALFLVIGLVHSYWMCRLGSFGLLQAFMTESSNAFYCSQSIIINMGAVALMVAGLKRRSREALVISTLVVVVGAVKVFIFDLFKGQGMPLVLSVFSFGVVAVASSVTMKRWQNSKAINN